MGVVEVGVQRITDQRRQRQFRLDGAVLDLRVEGGAGKIVTLAGEGPAQAKDALKDLRAVAGGRQEPSSQLALAEPEIRG